MNHTDFNVGDTFKIISGTKQEGIVELKQINKIGFLFEFIEGEPFVEHHLLKPLFPLTEQMVDQMLYHEYLIPIKQ